MCGRVAVSVARRRDRIERQEHQECQQRPYEHPLNIHDIVREPDEHVRFAAHLDELRQAGDTDEADLLIRVLGGRPYQTDPEQCQDRPPSAVTPANGAAQPNSASLGPEVRAVFLTGGQPVVGPAGHGLAASAFGSGRLPASLTCTRLTRGAHRWLC
ncbi:hypothetical protein [Streptomyces sp. CL12]|uniref:hypothetical protein n=1 Tax=Streptomyces sp. CL12 TaxID=3391744 RepID=UPI003A7FD472